MEGETFTRKHTHTQHTDSDARETHATEPRGNRISKILLILKQVLGYLDQEETLLARIILMQKDATAAKDCQV